MTKSTNLYSDNYDGYGPSWGYEWPVDMSGASVYYDWGVYNAILNGGNQPGLWRTMTFDEYDYMMKQRPGVTIGATNNVRFCFATVAEIKGIVIFPDDYVDPLSLDSIKNPNTSKGKAGDNEFTEEQWIPMEVAGAVFIAAAGYAEKEGTILQINSHGNYWLSSRSSTINEGGAGKNTYVMQFATDADQMLGIFGTKSNGLRPASRSYSVRLVQDVTE